MNLIYILTNYFKEMIRKIDTIIIWFGLHSWASFTNWWWHNFLIFDKQFYSYELAIFFVLSIEYNLHGLCKNSLVYMMRLDLYSRRKFIKLFHVEEATVTVTGKNR